MKLSVKELATFGIFAGLILAAKKLMEPLPNIHPVGLMICVLTVCYRGKALYPLYTYILLEGLLAGFNSWWVPYLYVWALLWGGVMLLPRGLSLRKTVLLCAILCGLHGLAFGVLYAPAEMLLYGFSLKTTIAWVVAGLPFDCIHGVSNLVLTALLSYPLIKLIHRLDASACFPQPTSK